MKYLAARRRLARCAALPRVLARDAVPRPPIDVPYMDFHAWRDSFEPVGEPPTTVGPMVDGVARMFDARAPDALAVQLLLGKISGRNLWTLYESDGRRIIAPGVREVDRIGYFVTRYRWTDPAMRVYL